MSRLRRLVVGAVVLGGLAVTAGCSAQPARGSYCPPGTQRFCEAGQCICIQR